MTGSQQHAVLCRAVLVRPVTGLKKFLKKNAVGQTLAVLDAKLGNIIKEKLDIPCVSK
jgi:hypothetical protein